MTCIVQIIRSLASSNPGGDASRFNVLPRAGDSASCWPQLPHRRLIELIRYFQQLGLEYGGEGSGPFVLQHGGIGHTDDRAMGEVNYWWFHGREYGLYRTCRNIGIDVLLQGHLSNTTYLKLMFARLSDDWQAAWQHPLALAETFVDPQLYQGTAYKVSGWCRLGRTAGFQRSAEDFYQKHDRPKQVWVRELVRDACRQLRAPVLPPAWAAVAAAAAPRCAAKTPEIRSLVEQLRAEVPECRSKKALAYPMAGMLALIALAMFSGARRGYQDLADYAATLSQGQLRALGFRCEPGTTRVRCPGVTPFREVLRRVDARAVERALLLWQDQVLGPTQDNRVIVDGKTLRHAHVELVSAVNRAGRWLGTVAVAEGSNEIPAVHE